MKHLNLTSQCVEFQHKGLRRLRRWGGRLEIEALLLRTLQQSLAQVGLVKQHVEEVSCRHAVKRPGAGAEVQSSLKDTMHPLLDLTSERTEINKTTWKHDYENTWIQVMHLRTIMYVFLYFTWVFPSSASLYFHAKKYVGKYCIFSLVPHFLSQYI